MARVLNLFLNNLFLKLSFLITFQFFVFFYFFNETIGSFFRKVKTIHPYLGLGLMIKLTISREEIVQRVRKGIVFLWLHNMFENKPSFSWMHGVVQKKTNDTILIVYERFLSCLNVWNNSFLYWTTKFSDKIWKKVFFTDRKFV